MAASQQGHAEVVDTLLLRGASADLHHKVTSCAPMCNKCVRISLYKNYCYCIMLYITIDSVQSYAGSCKTLSFPLCHSWLHEMLSRIMIVVV